MSEHAEAVLKQALTLSLKDRLTLVEKLLASLDQSDPVIDQLWATEAEDRISDYEAGEIETVPAQEVFKKFKKT